MLGKFITIEGGEGAGKSTAMAAIEDYLKTAGIEVLFTREPGGTALGEKIRQLLLDKSHHAMCADTELLLMFAARAQHLQEKILPALKQGQWVVCDRFTDATYAYQGGGRSLSVGPIATLENLVQGELRPDCVLLLDVAPELGLQRIQSRGETDRFESEQIAFFHRVREAYLQRAASDPSRYKIIDASQAVEKVQAQIQSALAGFIAEQV